MPKILTAILLLFALFFTACDEQKICPPERLTLLEDSARAQILGAPFKIRLQTMAASETTLLGGSVISPAVNVIAKIEVINAPTIYHLPPEVHTGSDGIAEFSLAAITVPGVYHFAITLPNYPKIKPLEVYVYGGITIANLNQDGWVDSVLSEPLIITAQKSEHEIAPLVNLSFDIRNAPTGTRLLANKLQTETENGQAKLEIRLGKTQGQGIVGMRVLSEPWRTNENVPDLKLRFFVIDGWNLLLGVAGGLAIFIFGMQLMSDGLTLIAGDRLRKILHTLTSNRFTAGAMGVAITGFIQSSSACSVMIIGFVNAALMSLEQAIGVIIGANIGTTVTAQMLSFKLEALAYPAIALGVILSLMAKKSYIRFLAQILVGFGLLFLGMQLMGKPLGELRHSQFIHSAFAYLDCQPVNGVLPIAGLTKAILAGAIMTVVMQSSSAFIGVLLALAAANLIDVYTAFAVLLGSNIGTTVTAVLATIGSSLAAKRTACAHVIFNLGGTILIVGSLYIKWQGEPAFMMIVDKITPGDIFHNENLLRFLANAHTLFNVACACVFILIVKQLARVTCWIIPQRQDVLSENETPLLLAPHLLSVPSLAISMAWREIAIMLEKGHSALFPSLHAVFAENHDDFENLNREVKQLETNVDKLQSSVVSYIGNITTEVLTEKQGATLPRILHSVNDAERVSDHAVHLLKLAKRVHKYNLTATNEARAELKNIEEALVELYANCVTAINTTSVSKELSEKSRAAIKRLHKLIDDAGKAHLTRQENGTCDFRTGAIYQEVLYNLHRVGSHLNNVIKAVGA